MEFKERLKDPRWREELYSKFGDTCADDLLLRHVDVLFWSYSIGVASTHTEDYIRTILEHIEEGKG